MPILGNATATIQSIRAVGLGAAASSKGQRLPAAVQVN
eukprot:CAMPEP_0181335836 /NCGR_PEP_ID=MMETSP1101-20121128/27063_1 /TAXON_ID=46948 /ORGANISM="Rhodomonas abbreviata, Strain Caron Lab Isolate" /LENGTH=37 /DNA_ID= /DNA_START= /DNA_END= /DNA_ORIENTATION=